MSILGTYFGDDGEHRRRRELEGPSIFDRWIHYQDVYTERDNARNQSSLALAVSAAEHPILLPLVSLSYVPPENNVLLADELEDRFRAFGRTYDRNLGHVWGDATGSVRLDIIDGKLRGTLNLESVCLDSGAPISRAAFVPGIFLPQSHRVRFAQNATPETPALSFDPLPESLSKISVYTRDRYDGGWSLHCGGPATVLKPIH